MLWNHLKIENTYVCDCKAQYIQLAFNFSGTSAHVGIIIYGSDGRTSARHLSKDDAFRRNGDDTFLVAIDHYLGDITKVKLWHDNTGLSPSWFVHRVIIRDVHTGKRYFFNVNQWFSLDTKDGAIQYEIPVSGKNANLFSFS